MPHAPFLTPPPYFSLPFRGSQKKILTPKNILRFRTRKRNNPPGSTYRPMRACIHPARARFETQDRGRFYQRAGVFMSCDLPSVLMRAAALRAAGASFLRVRALFLRGLCRRLL